MITPEIIQDYASYQHRDFPETLRIIGSDKHLYAGAGCLCWQVINAFLEAGIPERSERLLQCELAFGRPVVSTKGLTVGEARALLFYRAELGSIHV